MSYLLYLIYGCYRRCDGCDGKFGNFVELNTPKEVETDGFPHGELHLLRCTAAAMGEMRIGRICFVGTWDQEAPFIFATGRVESTAAAG